VLAQHVDQLQPDRVPEGFGHARHPVRLLAIDVRVDDRLAARLADRALLLRGKLQIDRHLFTNIN
jgi:hypothetical protein